MCKRQYELFYYFLLTNLWLVQVGQPVFVNLQHGYQFLKNNFFSGRCPCITPSSSIVVVTRDSEGATSSRLLTPREVWGLMGYGLPDHVNKGGYSYRDLIDMVGRGFHRGSLAAAFLGAMIVAAMIVAPRRECPQTRNSRGELAICN